MMDFRLMKMESTTNKAFEYLIDKPGMGTIRNVIWVEYSDGSFFKSSKVVNVVKDGNIYMVTTKNSYYEFEEVML